MHTQGSESIVDMVLILGVYDVMSIWALFFYIVHMSMSVYEVALDFIVVLLELFSPHGAFHILGTFTGVMHGVFMVCFFMAWYPVALKMAVRLYECDS